MMKTRVWMIVGLVAVVALVANALPSLWQQSGLSGSSGPHEALAGEDVMKEAAQEHLDVARQYEKDAEHHEAQAQRYEKKAAAITDLMDTKGFRRNGLRIAADSQSTMASESRYRAKVHRLEAELLLEKAMQASREK